MTANIAHNHCCISKCRLNSSKHPYLSFHSVPTKCACKKEMALSHRTPSLWDFALHKWVIRKAAWTVYMVNICTVLLYVHTCDNLSTMNQSVITYIYEQRFKQVRGATEGSREVWSVEDSSSKLFPRVYMIILVYSFHGTPCRLMKSQLQ